MKESAYLDCMEIEIRYFIRKEIAVLSEYIRTNYTTSMVLFNLRAYDSVSIFQTRMFD